MSEALVPCVLCGHRVGASTVLTHVCDFSDTSSLRAELAEAKATIARLTEELDEMRALIKREKGLMVSNLVADLVKRRNIAATAAAYVESCLCNGGTDVPQLNAAISRAFLSLVTAVEEGKRTDGSG